MVGKARHDTSSDQVTFPNALRGGRLSNRLVLSVAVLLIVVVLFVIYEHVTVISAPN
jgi:hypothetical protein